MFSAHKTKNRQNQNDGINQFTNLEYFDLNNSFHRALLKDVMNIYYPGQYEKNNEKIEKIFSMLEKGLRDKLQASFVEEQLSWEKFWQILIMYVKFLAVFIIVMALTYYGVQTIAVWRFCHEKQADHSGKWSNRFKSVLSGIVSFVLFCPAYVIAYSIRTELNTDTFLFMTLLCVISNGLLMVYSNKFFAFLVGESRKGYVETAIVKNLNCSYSPHTMDGIPYSSIFKLHKKFKGHVFSVIFKNAEYQYFSTIKEQASFLITGMVITEMALNIHGHLSYEMLRQILYKNYDIVIVILLGIFYTVKMTEIFSDYVVYRESKKYDNKRI
jgi:hypothetical protein